MYTWLQNGMSDKSLLPYRKQGAFLNEPRAKWMPLFFAAERKSIPFPRTEFNENARKLLRQREDVHGVAAARRVRLGSQAHTQGSNRAATRRDGDVLASVDRIRHGPTHDL